MSLSIGMNNNKEINQFVPAQAMTEFQDLIRESNDPLLLPFLENTAFLSPFLIGRKLNAQKAFDTVKGYLTTRLVRHPKLFEMKPRSVKHVLESGFIGLLKNRDHLGRVVGFVRCPKLDLQTMECMDIVRSVILLSESLWESGENMRNGQVGVLDYTDYSWSVMTRYSLHEKITFMNVFWHNYPMMIKGVHAVNNPRIVSYAYSLLKPFVPKKVKERFIMHGSDLSSLHEHLSPEILPTWLGGKLSDEEAIDNDLIQRILEQSD